MKNERGVALVIALFLMAALSALAVSLVFLSETETSASRNYKTMSQARYAAEAGVHRAINYLTLDTFKASMTANLANFDLTKSPVQYNNANVVLSATGGTANYPDSTVQAQFTNNVKGTLGVGTGNVAYGASATLLTMRTVDVYGAQPDIIMTWRITGTGTVCRGTGTCTTSDTTALGTLDVTATLERDLNNAQTYAVFATSQTCGALTIKGNAATDSYNSQTMAHTPPSGSDINTTSGGNVGTDGNLFIDNNAAASLGGSLYTPRSGAGSCSSSNPNAVSGPGSVTVAGSMVPLPQTIAFPDAPALTTTPGTTSITLAASDGVGCSAKLVAAGVTGWSCFASGSSYTLTPVSSTTLTLPNVTIGPNTNLTIAGGTAVTMNVNSFKLGSNASMTMTSTPNTTVTMNIAGQGLSGSNVPLDLSGGGTVNLTYDSTRFQILYNGTGEMDVVGNNTAAVTIYAPHADVQTKGSGNVYGSILSSTFTDTGGAHLHYDTALQKKYQILGNYAMSSFSWRKY